MQTDGKLQYVCNL